MEYTAKGLRKKLLSLVKKLGKTPEAYASRPGKDFTRRRALGFEEIVLLLLTMGSESVGKNLMEVFHFQEKTPSAPAFVQQRKKQLPKAMEALFHEFTSKLHPEKKYRGYRLFAVDGSSLKSAAYPQDPLSYLPGTDCQPWVEQTSYKRAFRFGKWHIYGHYCAKGARKKRKQSLV